MGLPIPREQLREGPALVGPRERKDGGGRPCMALLDRVSEGQLNERLMNASGSDEPITRTLPVNQMAAARESGTEDS
uniref:Uncharacterized protein n=1 Tax=Oryza punctata TaxID=4537 RepID=A0A0E0MN25_ORYPU